MGTVAEDRLNKEVFALAEECRFERAHSLQVCKLALSLFDQLVSLHKLGSKEKAWLGMAAILHDIGWIKGQEKHHKTSQELIIHSGKLSLSRDQLLIVGLVARYHRKSLPKPSHPYFCELDQETQRTVRILASFLRLADGLDRTHRSSIKQVTCEVHPTQIILKLKGDWIQTEDIETGKEKSDLLQQVFAREILANPEPAQSRVLGRFKYDGEAEPPPPG